MDPATGRLVEADAVRDETATGRSRVASRGAEVPLLLATPLREERSAAQELERHGTILACAV
jgi:hypothetical protein